MPADIYLLYGKWGSVTPEIHIPRKRNLKSPEVLPPRKYTIPNQDSTIIINQQYPNLPPNLAKGNTVHKPFIDDTNFSNTTEKQTCGLYRLLTYW